ncbi:MAG: MoaD family protein [Anaerolineae bacterium]|nr:MoaD family protein [Anaerolineae bacterium]
MTLHVNLYATFRLHAGVKTFTIDLPQGSTLLAAIHAIAAKYPVLAPQWLDENGALRTHVHCFVNDHEFLTLAEGVATPLVDGDTLDFFPPVAGGQSASAGSQYRFSMYW